MQRVLEAVLFFHPVTGYLSHHIQDERETCCDDLVLAIGGDRLHYAQSLLRVAELRLAASRTGKSLTALAADGQRPSKLRQRISRLLGDSEPTSIRMSTWILASAIGLCAGVIWSVGALSSTAIAVAQDAAKTDVQQVLRLVQQNRQAAKAIQTAHLRYRIARPGGGLKPDLTQKKVHQILETHDLTKSPDNFRNVMQELLDVELPVGATPWSTTELYQDENRFRASRAWTDGGTDEHVHDGKQALDWSAANHQMDIMPQAGDRMYEVTLHKFLPSRAPWFSHLLQDQKILKDATISSADGKLNALFRVEGIYAVVQMDPASGQLLRFASTRTQDENTTITDDYRWFGWRQYGENLWFPTVAAELKFANDTLTDLELMVVESASLNKPLPDRIFQLSAPAGSVVFDKRPGGRLGSINYYVYDVTSNEQLEAAFKPLSEELTDVEKAGVAEISRLYRLPDGVVMKHFGPPYSLARKHIGRLLSDSEVRFKHDTYANLLTWDGNKFEHAYFHDGGSFSAAAIALRFTEMGSAELEGDEDILELRIPGDFVYRKDVSVEKFLGELQQIVSDAAGTPVRIEFRDVERKVYRATGEFKLNLRGGSKYIEINGGRHTGHFGESQGFGKADRLISSVSAYVKTKIISEVSVPDGRLQWSERWYDLDSTKPEDRFVLDPEVVLEQITEQTGIKFAEEKQKVRVLFIERENGEHAASVPARAPNEADDIEPQNANINTDDADAMPTQAAAKLHGHVRDADGKPIAEANVAVRTTRVGTPIVVRAKTDANGRFELALSGVSWRKGEPLGRWVWHPGYAVNVETQFASKEDLATPVNITLTVPDKVRFRVTDPKRNGVAGGVVTPSKVAMPMPPGAYLITDLMDTVPEFLRRTSDADGIVELDSFQGASLHSLTIQSDDYGIQRNNVKYLSTSLVDANGVMTLRPGRLVRLQGRLESLVDANGVMTLRLQPTTRVRGRLVGAPAEFLKGIQVDLRSDVKNWPYGEVDGLATVVTDDEGRFEVAAIATGELSIWQHADSDAEWRLVPNKHTLIAGTSPEIEFVLKETIQVPFKIIREDSGLPVAGVGVSISDENRFHEVATGVSDERGEFRARVFENTWNFATVDRMPAEFTPPTDENDFALFHGTPVRFQSSVAADGIEVPVLQITVPKGKMLRGQLVDLDNKPLAHWTVLTQGSGGETDVDGKFGIKVRDNNQSPPNQRTLRRDPVPTDFKTHSPQNSRGVPKVISETPLVLQIMDYSKAILTPQDLP